MGQEESCFSEEIDSCATYEMQLSGLKIYHLLVKLSLTLVGLGCVGWDVIYQVKLYIFIFNFI